jgi:amino acid adenylation domain-containing protein
MFKGSEIPAGVNMHPASIGQASLFFLRQLMPHKSPYNIAVRFRLSGELDAKAMVEALREIARRHESCRTTFAVVDGSVVQIIHADMTADVSIVDFSAMADAEEQTQQLEYSVASETFDLERGPLIRARVVRLGPRDHSLIVVLDHIVADGMSLGVIWKELEALYPAMRVGASSPLPPPAKQYLDCVEAQNRWLETPAFSRQADFWKDHLAGAAPCDLPTDRPRPPIKSYRGNMIHSRIPRVLCDRMRALAAAENGSVFAVMLAALEILLARMSGQSDITILVPVACRNRYNAEEVIGYFANVIVLRNNVPGDLPFHDHLRNVRKEVMAGLLRQDVPFEQVIEKIRPERSLSRDPLSSVGFSFLPARGSKLELPGLEATYREISNGGSKFDLHFFVAEVAGELSLTAEYNSDIFDQARIERFLEHNLVLLEAIVADPGSTVSTMKILTDTERHQLLVEWNDTKVDYPADTCLHELFESQAEKTPTAVAVQSEGRLLSYRELNERANQLAHYLRRMGVGPDTLVGVCMERSVELVLALYAVLKAGGAYVPIDPEYPHERVSFMLQDADPPVLLTQARLASSLTSYKGRVVCVDSEWARIAGEGVGNLVTDVTPDNLAYMIYTSGSTGRPKGAMNTHRGICNRLLWMQDRYGLTEMDRVLQKTPFSFDVSVWEFFWPLLAGSRLVVAEPGGHRDAAYLVKLIGEQGITVLHFVPSMLRVFLEEPGIENCQSLRHVICSGEALPYDLQEQFFRLLPSQLHNLYGPTEAGVDVTHWTCRRDDDRKIVPIGRPVANTQIYILDRRLQPVPMGVPGELHIGGVQVGRGYHKRPELTAEKFIADPLSKDPEARLYKTGDLCRWLPDGAVEYLGRIDFQVKIRGFRIELGEVEELLRQHPAVNDAVVAVREDTPGDKRLVAYVLPSPEPACETTELRDYLKEKLPEYMIPAAIVLLSELPLSPNGKVDRNALPAPDASSVTRMLGDDIAPRTHRERRIAAIFEKLLGIPITSVNHNFFDLGGHSLMAIKLVMSIERELGIRMPLSSLFQGPTVAKLAAALGNYADGEQPVIPKANRGGPLPLSFAQERLWFLDQFDGPSATYNVYDAWHLRGSIDVAAFSRALGALVQRHEALRTTFAVAQDTHEPVQQIHASIEVRLVHTDLSANTGIDRLGEARRLANETAGEPFDLARGPLLRAHLVTLAPDEHVFVLVVHHIVFDGWSADIVYRELEQIYAAFCQGKQPALAPCEIHYADYAAWERLHLTGENLDARMEFWRQYLDGDPDQLRLPTDFTRPQLQSYRGDQIRTMIDPKLVQQLRDLGRSERATLYHVVMAAWKILLLRHSNQRDLVVGTFISNRRHAEVESVVGFFVNTVAVRTRLEGDVSVRQAVSRVRDSTVAAVSHNDVPFEQLVQEFNPARNLGITPIFQVCLSFESKTGAGRRFHNLELQSWPLQMQVSKFDLTLWLTDSPDGLCASLEYATGLFTRETAERMLAHFGRILEEMVGQPDSSVDQLQMITEAERRQILLDWNRTAQEYPRERCVHDLFEEQARQQPEAVALVFGGQTLTYGELNNRADELAALLRVLGVGPGVLVGLCVGRSFDMVVGLLGILKAGAAYVPIDPAYPHDRIAFVLEDSCAPVLLTQRPLLASLPATNSQTVLLDEPLPAADRHVTLVPTSTASASNLAYVLYTSGSTGKPKGVQIEHRAVVNFLHSMRREPGLTSDDILLAVTTLSFDIAGLELFLPLTTGARVVIAPWEVTVDGEALLREIDAHGITMMQATPATWRLMLAAGWKGTPRLKALCGGEAVPADLASELIPRCAELWNMYGPTETTIWSTVCRITDAGNIHIGRPIENTEIYILDESSQPLPVGLPGELLIGGEGLARGYLNRPQLTAERFVAHPFKPGARLYRTGDLARYRSDGNIDCLGRLDFQVKIRGFRIELGEIEAQLASHPGVQQNVVVAREDTPGEKRLIAYVVPSPAATPSSASLREHLHGMLPDYMVPAAFVVLESLPLTPNGKINRKALPAPDATSIAPILRDDIAPSTDGERGIAAIFESLLGVPVASVNDDFFDLGGHSLMAVKLMMSIERELGIRMPLSSLFQGASVAELACALGNYADEHDRWHSLVPINVQNNRPALFLVHGAGGNVLLYRQLARALAPDISVYGFQSQGLDRRGAPLKRVEDMAARYVRELRDFQPTGPYHIGGYCMGGSVAYEMARLLQKEDQTVGVVALLDTYNLSAAKRLSRGEGILVFLSQKLGFHVSNLKQLGAKDLFGYLTEKLRMADEAVRGKLAGKFNSIKDAVSAGIEEPGAEVFIQKINHEAGWEFVPQPFAGHISVFRPQKNYDHFPDPKMGWSELVGNGLEIVELPLNPHAMLIEPFAARLAWELKKRIEAYAPAQAVRTAAENRIPRRGTSPESMIVVSN